MGFRRVWRFGGIAAALGAAVATGWYVGQWEPVDESSLMTEPAVAPASPEAADVMVAAAPQKAETAEKSVLSAWNEDDDPIRVDGHAAAAMGGAADGQQDVLLELVTSESRLVTSRMAQEIAQLRQDLDAGEARIRKLSEALAEAQAALDVAEMRRAELAGAVPRRAMDAPVEARVLDANPDLGLVVLDQGARQGVRYGLTLTVLRDRKRVARLRVVDVRERIAGAAVEETARGDYPQTGDRAVLVRAPGP